MCLYLHSVCDRGSLLPHQWSVFIRLIFNPKLLGIKQKIPKDVGFSDGLPR
jgi:hypothetical protein